MGKATKRKQQELLARQPDYNNLLLVAKETQAKKEAEVASFDPMKIIHGYESHAIRPLDDFMPRTRSLNTDTRTKELVRYAFNKYNPPAFLYSVWDTSEYERQPGVVYVVNRQTGARIGNYDYLFGLKEDFRMWYLALVQGKSLYKECTMGLLSKRETFYFSTCPHPMTIPQVVWYSVIRCIDEKSSAALARKIATTKIHERPVDDFWKGVARWFMNNETSIKRMNDLLDYITNRHRERPDWYLKDQTLNALERAMRSWHREMYRTRTMVQQYTKWEGIKVEDSTIERGQGKKKITWRFHQIKTGAELAEEGNRQHHCVSAYGRYCSGGECSIWSLTYNEKGVIDRALTIELRANGTIAQARGYANRLPRAEEMSVLKEWATKHHFTISRT